MLDDCQFLCLDVNMNETRSKGIGITKMASQISFFLQWFSIFMRPEPRKVQVVKISSRYVKDC